MEKEKREPQQTTVESRVAETVLQRLDEVAVCGKTYHIAPASTATLILASEAVSRLPQRHLEAEHIMEESLSVARDCAVIGEIAAILILGAKYLNAGRKGPQIESNRPLWRFFGAGARKRRAEKELRRLSAGLLEELTPSELHKLVARLLQRMQIADFFALTTFLIELNLTRPTKVVTEATASGQS